MKHRIQAFWGIICILCLTVTFAHGENLSTGLSKIRSDDGMVEEQFTSIDTGAYPIIKLYHTLSVPAYNLSVTLYSTLDLTDNLQSFVQQHPEYRGQQVPITLGGYTSFSLFAGTMYREKYYLLLGSGSDEQKVNVTSSIDLSEWWPIDFVNEDIERAARYVKDIRDTLKRPDSIKLIEATLGLNDKYPDGRFYQFKVSAENSYDDPKESTYYAWFVPNHSYSLFQIQIDSLYASLFNSFSSDPETAMLSTAFSFARDGNLEMFNTCVKIISGSRPSKDNLAYFAAANYSYYHSYDLDTSSILEHIN